MGSGRMLLLEILLIASFQGSIGINLPGTSSSIFDIDGIYELIKEVVSKGQFASSRGEAINFFDDRCEVMLGELLDKVDELSEKLDVMEDRIMNRLDGLEKLVKNIANDVQRKNLIHKVVIAMKAVKENRDTLVKYARMKKRPYKSFIAFLQDITSARELGLEEKLKVIHRTVVAGSHTSSFEETLLDVMESTMDSENGERCNENSPQQVLYTLYTTIAATELMGFSTIVYSAKLLQKEIENEDTDLEIELFAESVQERMQGYIKSFFASIKRVERNFRTCDPEKGLHVRDVTFTEMWGIIQGIVMNEFGLLYSDSCSGTCEEMWGFRTFDPQCWYKNNASVIFRREKPSDYHLCPTPRKCMGLLHDCKTLWETSYCKLTNSTRRYEFVKDKYNQVHYGSWTACENGILSEYTADVDRVYKCTECFCICNDDRAAAATVHTVSLIPSRSRSKYNRVIVGVRMKVEGRILQLQVQEAPISREYIVNTKEASWVYLDKIGREVEVNQNSARMAKMKDALKEGKDFHSFQVAKDAFNLNEVLLEYNRVVTGVKFGLAKKDPSGARLEIQVESMEYNPSTGELVQGTERLEKSSTEHDSELEIKRLLPQNAETKTKIVSRGNQYIELRPSDLEEDGGQTVLPLFDAQTVHTRPIGPFGGLGLHYRAPYEEGGFIALTGYSLDFAGFLENSEKSRSSDTDDVLGPLTLR